ncbi:GcrA family cell cycle regulator [Rhizobium rhizogenes]|uniref:GcrA family cell cycle regulator n=1 Tax=Rhizobium rhizogenes TaxID=359 RepID=UPI0015723C7D|nr:GcrA family cell cycle regulator [Rhizobium rhizogenes]NTG94233.1 GcrA cell cycle regulator [Rhizobium rhizogenes]
MIWTDERIESLKTLHAEGLSASKIAARLGGVSRNAVIGKVVRLGLGPLQGNHQVKSKVAIVRAPRSRKAKPDPVKISELQEFMDRAPPPVVEAIPKPVSLGLKLLELSDFIRECRWPEGERADITFCGHDVVEGKSWCPYHARLAMGRGTESERKAVSALERAA